MMAYRPAQRPWAPSASPRPHKIFYSIRARALLKTAAEETITLNISSHVLPDLQDSAADAMEAALGTI
jgi:hypothetical protein